MKFLRLHILSLLALCICIFFAPSSYALDIETVRVGHHPDKTRIVIELNSFVDYKAFLLHNPYRLIIDLPMFVWQAGETPPPPSSGVTSIRHSAYQPGLSRIVFDLDSPYVIKAAFTLPPGANNSHHRLVLDLRPASLDEFSKEGLHQNFGTLSAGNTSTPIPEPVRTPAPTPTSQTAP